MSYVMHCGLWFLPVFVCSIVSIRGMQLIGGRLDLDARNTRPKAQSAVDASRLETPDVWQTGDT